MPVLKTIDYICISKIADNEETTIPSAQPRGLFP